VPVSGLARTFEANVQIRILDADGTAIVETFTTAQEAAPALSPFTQEVEFAVDTTQPGCIEVFEVSAADGSEINIVQVPVTLEAQPEDTPTPLPVDGTPTPPAIVPPPTGTGDAAGSATSAWTFAAIAALLMLAVAIPTFALARRRA
jgi:hypothetical protein